MLPPLVALMLVVGADPQPKQPVFPKVEMPKMTDGLAPLKPLSSQTPLLRPVPVPPLVTSVQQSLNLSVLPKPKIDLRVKECERKPDIVGGKVADALGRPHKWLVVEDRFGNIVHAPGLGNKQGVPGANGQTFPDCLLSKTYIRNHSNDVPRSCKLLPTVDPICVISKTPYNRYVGGFWPYINDCNTFTQRTINACQMPNFSASPLWNPRPNTVWNQFSLTGKPDTIWDRFSLLGKPDGTTKYSLGNMNQPKPTVRKPK